MHSNPAVCLVTADECTCLSIPIPQVVSKIFRFSSIQNVSPSAVCLWGGNFKFYLKIHPQTPVTCCFFFFLKRVLDQHICIAVCSNRSDFLYRKLNKELSHENRKAFINSTAGKNFLLPWFCCCQLGNDMQENLLKTINSLGS